MATSVIKKQRATKITGTSYGNFNTVGILGEQGGHISGWLCGNRPPHKEQCI